jgi:hypothetical protein
MKILFKDVQKLKQEGKTYQEIGLIYGVSRQRIEQIYNKTKQISINTKHRIIRKNNFICSSCSKKFEFSDLLIVQFDGQFLVCCKECHRKFRRSLRGIRCSMCGSIDGNLSNAYNKTYYYKRLCSGCVKTLKKNKINLIKNSKCSVCGEKGLKNFKRKLCKKCYEHYKYTRNTEKYKERTKKYRELNLDRCKENSRNYYYLHINKIKEYHKKRYYEMKKDPIKYAKYLENHRKFMQSKYDRLKNLDISNCG